MNAKRRKAIGAACEELAALIGKLEDLKSTVEDLASEEREYYENMPESIREGEKGEAAELAASALEEALNQIEEAVTCAQSAHDGMAEATE